MFIKYPLRLDNSTKIVIFVVGLMFFVLWASGGAKIKM